MLQGNNAFNQFTHIAWYTSAGRFGWFLFGEWLIEARPGHGLFWQMFVVFLSPTRRMLSSTTASFWIFTTSPYIIVFSSLSSVSNTCTWCRIVKTPKKLRLYWLSRRGQQARGGPPAWGGGGWARGEQLLAVKDQLITKCYTGPRIASSCEHGNEP
jgi:hypothetical protein